jgi:predicted dehydrogenase
VKALVIGYGSIGQRHARLLTEMGCQVAVTSRRAIEFTPHYLELGEALDEWQPAYVVVADRTSEHHETLKRLASHGFCGRVLVEKPLFDRPLPLPANSFAMQVVGYNMRCHPLLLRLQRFLAGQAQLVAASLYVGQYLPQWRPGTDYRESYSARRHEGGGVLRDLSHELDYALWLFGPWHRLTAIGGKFSNLEIDSDDTCALLMETERCPAVSVQLSYLDRKPRREILVHTGEHSVRADLVGGVFEVDGVQEKREVSCDATYRAEHQAMLAANGEGLCNAAEALETLTTIEAAERAASTHTWVQR